jgi:hypothetical protein
VKKLIIALVLIGACRTTSTVTTPSGTVRSGASAATGAADPEAAIREFMAAAKAQDLDAMSGLFADKAGLVRDQVSRTELRQREYIMVCYLKHDRFDIVGQAPSTGDGRSLAVSVSLGDVTRSTTFELLQGTNKRWYVFSIDIGKLQDICARRG